MKIKVKKLSPDAIIPTKAYNTDAGWDLYSNEDVTIEPGCRRLIKTDIAMEIPNGWYGQIKDRSGMAYKKMTHIFAGVVDSDFRGTIGIVMFSFAMEVEIKKGDKIAQILFLPVPVVELVESDELSDTSRGAKGYGSSDKKKEKKNE